MSRLLKKLQTRCSRCRLRPALCLCSEFPTLDSLRTELRLLIHRYEGNTTTNTGLLACEVIPGSRVLWRGWIPEERSDAVESSADPWLQPEELFSEGRTPLLLFPEVGAQVVDESWMLLRRERNPEEKFTLLVPDGSWRQAKRVGRREPALTGVTRVTLRPGPPSEYQLRREPHPSFVCTFEAIARILGVIEGGSVQAQLETLFRKFVGRQLWSRGDLQSSEVVGGIPEAAIYERKVSGFPKKWS
jgi:DTW domain-containing protein YfiP